jgi:hypothetical protein
VAFIYAGNYLLSHARVARTPPPAKGRWLRGFVEDVPAVEIVTIWVCPGH